MAQSTPAPSQDANVLESLFRLRERLEQIKDGVKAFNARPREVVFLPVKAEHWNAMESLWKAVNEDGAYRAVVVPVPWRYRDDAGVPRKELHEEGDRLPPYVPVTSWREYDFRTRFPFAIITQNATEKHNLTLVLEPEFSAAILKGWTRHLVYVPWFVTNELDYKNPFCGKAAYNMRYYVSVPGVVHADLVVVQSEGMRESYVEELVRMGGEETRPVWERKIRGFGSPLFEKSTGDGYEDIPVSGLWEKIKFEWKEAGEE